MWWNYGAKVKYLNWLFIFYFILFIIGRQTNDAEGTHVGSKSNDPSISFSFSFSFSHEQKYDWKSPLNWNLSEIEGVVIEEKYTKEEEKPHQLATKRKYQVMDKMWLWFWTKILWIFSVLILIPYSFYSRKFIPFPAT